MYIFNHSRNLNLLQVKVTELVTTAQQLLTTQHVVVISSKRNEQNEQFRNVIDLLSDRESKSAA